MTDQESNAEDTAGISDAEQYRTINDRRYRVNRLPFYKGLATLKLLKEVTGDSLFGVMRSGLDAMTIEVVGTLVNLLGSLGDPRMIEALNTMSINAAVLADDHMTWEPMVREGRKGKPGHSNLDTLFQLHPEDALPYLSFLLEVNYRAFFTGGSNELTSLLTRLPPEIQEFLVVLKDQGSKFLEGLTGSSGDSSEPGTATQPLPKSESTGT
jgi:hypothetical protein